MHVNNVLYAATHVTIRFLLIVMFFSTGVFAQEPLKLIPDMPAYSIGDKIGNFAESEVNYAHGDFTKKIDLYNISNKSIEYPLSLYYNSRGGVLVDDWGSRTGLSWGSSFETKIVRQVNGLPDEWDNNSLRNEDMNVMSEMSSSNLTRIRSINDGYQRSGQSKDGEFDVYSVSIKGESLNFIINQDTGILLNHTDDFKILKTPNPDYQFLITDSEGNKYFFGGVYTETHKEFDAGFGVKYSLPIKTGWYLRRIQSATNDDIFFSYSPANYRILKALPQQANMCIPPDFDLSYIDPSYHNLIVNENKYMDFPQVMPFFYDFNSYVLTSIEASNGIRVFFDKETRDDVVGDFLFKSVSVFDGSTFIKKYNLEYNHIISPNFSGNESFAMNNLDYLSSEAERSHLRHRYFLKKISEVRGESHLTNDYLFEYKNPHLIAPRFSFSQDVLGYPILRNNPTVFPKSALENFVSNYNKTNPTFPFIYTLSDRTTDITANDLGLLTKVKYHTGVEETIDYETNTFFKEEIRLHYDTYSISTEQVNSPFEYWPGSSFYHYGGNLEIDINLEYRLYDLPRPEDRDLYHVHVALFDVNTETYIDLAYHMGVTGFIDDSPIFGKKYLYVDLVQPKRKFITSPQRPIPEGQYEIVVDLYKLNIYSKVDAKYVSMKEPVTEHNFYGVRVKEMSYVDDGQLKYKRNFIYKVYNPISENELQLTNRSSLIGEFLFDKQHHDFLGKYPDYGSFVYLSPPWGTQYDFNLPIHRRTLVGRSLYDYALYSGRHHIYHQVAEVVNDSSFTIYSFTDALSFRSNQIFGMSADFYRTAYQHHWKNGLIRSISKGTVDGGIFSVLRKEEIEYDYHSLRYFNNYFSKTVENIMNTSNTLYDRLNLYDVYNYLYYSIWFYEKTRKITDFHNGNRVSTLLKSYYDPNDKLLCKQEKINSMRDTLTTLYFRPSDKITTATYMGMVAKNILSPVIEEKHFYNDRLLSTKIKKYRAFYPGIYLVDTIKTVNESSDIIESEHVDLYSLPHYNPVQFAKTNRNPIVLLWGYSGKYPVAKIENATYADVVAVLGQASIDNLDSPSVSEATINNTISILRNDSRMSDAQISTYTYQPLVGMTSMTDPRGVTEYYEYDGFQRLKGILDFDKNLQKHYEYNYKP